MQLIYSVSCDLQFIIISSFDELIKTHQLRSFLLSGKFPCTHNTGVRCVFVKGEGTGESTRRKWIFGIFVLIFINHCYGIENNV